MWSQNGSDLDQQLNVCFGDPIRGDDTQRRAQNHWTRLFSLNGESGLMPAAIQT